MVGLVKKGIPETEKGVADGVATLDGTGKVPVSQMPSSIIDGIIYQGTWNASTNSPTLADGTGTKGHYYVVSVAGSQDLGSGTIAFDIDDWVVHNGTIWEQLDSDNATVLADATDPTKGFLDSKVDDSTIEVDVPSHKIRVKSGVYEPADATIIKENDNVSLLTNNSNFQSGTQVDGKITTHAGISAAHHVDSYRVLLGWSSELDIDIAVITGKHRVPIMFAGTPVSITIKSVRTMIETVPTGAPVKVDIHKNGTTIFTDQGKRPEIAISGNDSGEVTDIDVTSLAKGDYLTMDVDQIGSTIAGQNLVVAVEVEVRR